MPMTNRVLILATVLSTSALGLTSCGRDKVPTVAGQGADPLFEHALAGPLMTHATGHWPGSPGEGPK
jgi:hypothetical protein